MRTTVPGDRSGRRGGAPTYYEEVREHHLAYLKPSWPTVKDMGNRLSRSSFPKPLVLGLFLVAFGRRSLSSLQRCSQNVTERSTGVGRSVLGDGFLLLGDLERLDRHGNLAGLLVEGGDTGIDLLARGKPLRPLLRTLAGEVSTTDEGGEIGIGNLHVDAGFLHLDHLAGDHGSLFDRSSRRRFREGIAANLLHAK